MHRYYHDPYWSLSIIIIVIIIIVIIIIVIIIIICIIIIIYIYISKLTKLDHCSLEPHGDMGIPQDWSKTSNKNHWKQRYYTPAEQNKNSIYYGEMAIYEL